MGEHVSVFIQDEIDARGWDEFDLAIAMGGDADKSLLVWRVIKAVGPEKVSLRIGASTAHQLAKAFGVSDEFFLNIEKQWLESQGAQP